MHFRRSSSEEAPNLRALGSPAMERKSFVLREGEHLKRKMIIVRSLHYYM